MTVPEAFSEKALAAFTKLHNVDVEEIESDLWKPKEVGELFRGVYLGKTFDSITKQATGEAVPLLNFICKSEIDGTPYRRRIRENVVLQRAFENMPMNTIVELEYMGEKVIKAGQNPMKDFKIFAEVQKSK